MQPLPIHFISEPIEVQYITPPQIEKTPACPQSFTWQGQTYTVLELLAEWHDFQRRGRAANNMRPEHLATAVQSGSWGVGRFYFRVRVSGDRIFEIYYDRSPSSAAHRKGSWVLYSEHTAAQS